MFHSFELFRPTPTKPMSGWSFSNTSTTGEIRKADFIKHCFNLDNSCSCTPQILMAGHCWVGFKPKLKT